MTDEFYFPFAAKLVRYSFPDRPNWELLDDSIPLGTLYKVLSYEKNVTVINLVTGEDRLIECYLVEREDAITGFLPAVCLQPIEN